MSSIRYSAYQIPTGEWVLHPEDGKFCGIFHAQGKKCICEAGFPKMDVSAVHGYYIDSTPELVDTGYRIEFRGHKYEVLSVE